MPAHTLALLVAAGQGSRYASDLPKQYQRFRGVPLLRYTLQQFLASPAVDNVCVVIHPEHQALYDEAIRGLEGLLPPVIGGEERQDSVRLGLEALAPWQPGWVLIHDAARPLVSESLIERVATALDSEQAVVPVMPVVDTVKKQNGAMLFTLPREGLYTAQTPQGFHYPVILEAHRQAVGQKLTDDAAVAEWAGIPVACVAGDRQNSKITTPEDTYFMEALHGQTRIGTGFDVHALVEKARYGDKPLLICGVEIPGEQSLAGHSDADVGLHAIVDALLGAVGEGDIGDHFPPSDPQWKGVDSLVFLEHTRQLLAAKGATITNIDLTIICEAPRVGPYKAAMRQKVAAALGIQPEMVNIKGKTTEKLGFLGRGEGVAVQAVAAVRYVY